MEINSCKFIKDFELILKADNFKSSLDFSLKKYNLKDNKFSIILENSDFRCDLYETLKKLLIFYDEGEYYQEKYILLLLHLIFGVNPIEKNKVMKNNITDKKTKNSNLIISNLDNNYLEQNERMEELITIILDIIKKIQELQNSNNTKEQQNTIDENNSDDNEEDIEYKFESEIKEFFFRHYSLFFYSLHKLINTLYSQMEIGSNDTPDYVLFMKILCENKNNFRPLILSKFSRILNNYNNEELELLSLLDEINFSNPYDLIKTNQRLKSLIYLTKQKGLNNSVLYYENVKYVNEHFLLAKYKISEKRFNNIYSRKEEKYEKENIKENMIKQIENIKNDIIRINFDYQNDLNVIKNNIFQIQNKFNKNIKQLKANLINLNLELEKLDK